MVTDRKSSKLVVLLTGMVSFIYAVANPIIYGRMSMRYRWAYKRVFGAACRVCRQKPRSWSLSSISKHYFLILSFRCGVRRKPTVFPRLLQVIWFFLHFAPVACCMLHCLTIVTRFPALSPFMCLPLSARVARLPALHLFRARQLTLATCIFPVDTGCMFSRPWHRVTCFPAVGS